MAETENDGALRTLIVDDEPLAVERMQVICAKLKDLAERADQLLGDALDDEAGKVRTEAFNTLWAWYSKNPQVPLTRGASCRHADVRVRVVGELARLKKRPPGEGADDALLSLVIDSSAKVICFC